MDIRNLSVKQQNMIRRPHLRQKGRKAGAKVSAHLPIRPVEY